MDKNLDKNTELILESMETYEQSNLFFSSIIGFFYQFGISCDVDRNKALELYLLAVNNGKKEFLDQNFIYFHSSNENDNEFSVLRNNNIIIGKYLLSLFYYKDIILCERKLSELNLKSVKKDDPVAQFKFGYCYQYGQGIAQDSVKAFEWYYKSANSGYAEGQYNVGNCYYNGLGVEKDYNKAFEWYLKSANNGNAEVQNILGNCYYNGFRVKKDFN